ncbi:MAG TPA: 3-methyl-2-oxobutanoate hydroxymethyltransferase [Candidatus Saccharimonadales bacterium]|nr:3-methyl-2-oxobutanoate hydroxymethyltransferase [Candidatus Saccharimonadales bacterium]
MDEQSISRKPIQITDLARWKREGKRFAALTAYDYTTAAWLDRAGIPVLLVGDSLGGVILGHHLRDGAPDTIPVTLDEMIHHARAVSRAVTRALVVGDMPFLSYQLGLDDATRSAGRFLKEGRVQAVKLEGGGPIIEVVAHLAERGIAVMGHLGLTPQSAHAMGGLRAQGKTDAGAARIRSAFTGLEQAGAFAVVLEGMPAQLAAELTATSSIPTIGIGAGAGCDGQVLVVHDMLGLKVGSVPKFVKRYANLGEEIVEAAARYQSEIEAGTFPDPEHSYG